MISRVLDPHNYVFSLYMMPTLVTGLAVLLLGGLVLLRERITRVSLSFALLTLTVAIWLTAFSFMYVANDEQVALFWARAGYLGVPFIASATYTFASSVLRRYRPSGRLVLLNWVLMGGAALAASWNDLLIVEMRPHTWGYYPIYGWFGVLFILVFCGILVDSLMRFWLEYRQAPPSRYKRRIRWLMVAFGVGYLGVVDFLPVFGIPLYPFGYLPIFGFIMLAAYAIWVYRLLDITPAFAAKQIIETMSEALLVLDSARVIRLVNQAARDLFGYSNAELVGKVLATAIQGADFPPQLYQLERSDTIEDLEMPYVSRDGDPRTITLSASTTQEKRPEDRALIVVARDVTERKRMTEALRESERYQRSLMEQASDGIFITDLEGNFLIVNSKACEMLGYTEQELVRMKNADVVAPESLQQIPLRLAEMRMGSSVLTERLLLRKDGTTFPVEINGKLLSDGRFQAIARDITERKQAQERLKRQLDRLDALRSIDMAITASLDLRVTLSIILDQVCSQLRVDAAGVLLLDRATQLLEYEAGRGFRLEVPGRTHVRLGEGYAGRSALERRTLCLPDIRDTGDPANAHLPEGEGFIAYYAVPLVAKGYVKGVLEVFHRSPLDAQSEWLAFLEALAGQAAIAIDNASMFDDLQHSNAELALAYDTTLEGWSRALDLRDHETEGHTRRVTEMTVRLARAMGVPDAELAHIRRGALLHDIGKMGIPDSILLKPGPLTDEERQVMQLHPVHAYDLLAPIAFLRPALDIPYCHHEKWDGSGYPRGLRGEQIPLSARIFAVADVWDALTSDRPYRPAWPPEEVLEHIKSQSGTHFEPRVVDLFLSVVEVPGSLSPRDLVASRPGALPIP